MTVSEWKRVFVEQTAIWLLYSPVVNVSRLADVPFTFSPSSTKPLLSVCTPSITGAVVSSIVNVVSRGSCTVVS